MKRVVITGMGAVTPIGNSFQISWEAAKTGLSGIASITKFDVSEIRWKVAGELRGFSAELYLSQKEINHLDPFVYYAIAASLMAVKDAGLTRQGLGVSDEGAEEQKKHKQALSLATCLSSLKNAGVIIGSSRGGIGAFEKGLDRLKSSNNPKLSPYLMPSASVNMAAAYTAQKFGIKGYCLGISNACASGANAIGEAYRLIKSGHADIILAGGTEAPICRLCIEGYGATGALSRINDSSASRPFDKTRDGFVLSEGSCVLVLESAETALQRGARIYGEIIGYGNTADAFHQTRPSPEGEARAISMAIREGGMHPEDIDYISAHAPSTPLGDKSETDAIKLVFGKKAHEIPVSSVKSMTGHMLSASGAFEAAIALMSIKEGIIAPTINLKQRDPECNLNYAAEMRKADIKAAISHSFGFGGVNAVLIFREIDVA